MKVFLPLAAYLSLFAALLAFWPNLKRSGRAVGLAVLLGPGIAQLYNKKRVKAVGFIAAFLGVVSAMVIYLFVRSTSAPSLTVTDIENGVSQEQAQAAYGAGRAHGLFSFLIFCLYAYSIYDAHRDARRIEAEESSRAAPKTLLG